MAARKKAEAPKPQDSPQESTPETPDTPDTPDKTAETQPEASPEAQPESPVQESGEQAPPEEATTASGESADGAETDAGTDQGPARVPDAPTQVAAAPLEAPARPTAAGPHQPLTSNQVAVHAGLSSMGNQRHVRVLGEDGQEVGPDDIFDFGPEGTSTAPTVKQRIEEEYIHPGTTTPVSRLLYNRGTVVPRDRADALVAEMRRVREAASEQGEQSQDA